jgi:hypothetical protein
MMMSDVRAGIFGGFSEWWHNLRTAWNEVDELKRCGRETENIARDVGLSTSELYTIAAKRPDAANQVRRRLEALQLTETSCSMSTRGDGPPFDQRFVPGCRSPQVHDRRARQQIRHSG